MATVKQLAELDKLAEHAVQHWRAYLVSVEAQRIAGDDQPFLRGTAGFKAAGAVRQLTATLLGNAAGWPKVSGFGVLSQRNAAGQSDPVEPDGSKCNIDECGKTVMAIGLCAAHYQQHYRARSGPKRRSECIAGRKNHSYDVRGKCMYCAHKRS